MSGDPEAHVRRLWRHHGATRPAPRRGPRQRLDLDEILDAAVAIADAEGIEAVSVRALAARFGLTPMALYAYVGPKEDLLALLQDRASTPPAAAVAALDDPPADLADALRAWASALFDVYLAHPWLTDRPWSRASQGPHEQDWLERLLGALDRGRVPPGRRATAVTMLYATVRACAQTAAAYRRMDQGSVDRWRALAEATREHVPELARRYPRSTTLEPVTPQWRDNPRAAVDAAVDLLATALHS